MFSRAGCHSGTSEAPGAAEMEVLEGGAGVQASPENSFTGCPLGSQVWCCPVSPPAGHFCMGTVDGNIGGHMGRGLGACSAADVGCLVPVPSGT